MKIKTDNDVINELKNFKKEYDSMSEYERSGRASVHKVVSETIENIKRNNVAKLTYDDIANDMAIEMFINAGFKVIQRDGFAYIGF